MQIKMTVILQYLQMEKNVSNLARNSKKSLLRIKNALSVLHIMSHRNKLVKKLALQARLLTTRESYATIIKRIALVTFHSMANNVLRNAILKIERLKLVLIIIFSVKFVMITLLMEKTKDSALAQLNVMMTKLQ